VKEDGLRFKNFEPTFPLVLLSNHEKKTSSTFHCHIVNRSTAQEETTQANRNKQKDTLAPTLGVSVVGKTSQRVILQFQLPGIVV
jgi:hypothetical protein